MATKKRADAPDDADQAAPHNAAEIIAQVEAGPRNPGGWFPKFLTIGLCVGWSVFQLLHANSEFATMPARYIHLAFAFALCFLLFPAFKVKIGKPEKSVRGNAYYAIFLVILLLLLIPNAAGMVEQFTNNERWSGVLWALGVILVTFTLTIETIRRLFAAFFLAREGGGGGIKLDGWAGRIAGVYDVETSNTRIAPYDYALAALSSGTALYLIWDFDLIVSSGGLIGQEAVHQLVFSLVIVFLLMEASRRALGAPLAILVGIFLIYALWPQLAAGDVFGIGWLDGIFAALWPTLPDFLNPPPQPLFFMIGEMYLTDTSIFGVPIDVSVTFVFLFVLFAALLERAGAGKYFVDVAFAGLGDKTAGPAKAAVVASGATGLVSGSSIANTVTTGTFTIPLMKSIGLPAHKAGAVEVASSTNGQLMPPLMGAAAFIMADFIPHVDYADVVRAAFFPAIISYLALVYVVHLEALKLGLKRVSKDELPPLLKTTLRGLHYLVPLGILIYFLLVDRKTPSTAALYAMEGLAVIMLTQRPIIAYLGLGAQKRAGTLDPSGKLGAILGAAFLDGLVDIYRGLVNGARNMIPIGIATATAGIIVGVITVTGLAGRFTTVIETLSFGNIYIALILTALTGMILGMGLPTTVNYILMASLTAPVVLHIADANGIIVPVIAAHMFVFYFGILADDTPPVGLAAYAAAALARADPIRTGIQGFVYDLRTAILPFVFFFNTELLMISGAEENGAPIWMDDYFLMAFVFFISLAAMFAFAAAVQGYFAARCRLWERLALAVACVLMFLPSVVSDDLDISRRIVQVFGLVLMVGIYVWQRIRTGGRGQLAAQGV